MTKEERSEEKKSKKAFNEMVRRAKKKGALVSVQIGNKIINYEKIMCQAKFFMLPL